MCGIFGYRGDKYTREQLIEFLKRNKHRGPDNTKYKECGDIFFGFNRLRVNGLDSISDQPFHMKGCYLICNGEIYNYKALITKYGLEDEYKSHSDCEIIIHLYRLFGIKGLVRRLDGVFAFMLYDELNDQIYVARDPLGIRFMYCSFADGQVAIASEMKSLTSFKDVAQFPSGHYWTNGEFHSFYNFDFKVCDHVTDDIVTNGLRVLFERAVEKRLMADRKVACLLSGGLDSTLVAAIVCKKLGAENINTYSIGMKGSVDLKYAQIAADYFGTNHTNIELTEEEFLGAIESTIKQIESWDTTTVRASVGNYLVSLYIDENSDDDKVIFCGDVSDEMFASYRGFMSADTDENLIKENIEMLKNIRFYDVLRSDKSISGAGLEARVPFGDLELMEFVMSLPAKYKKFDKEKMEKFYIRTAFDGYLPEELLWRRKEAFSDGVSSHQRSWFEVIKEFVDSKITDEEYEEKRHKYTHCQPYDKESLFYREIFDKYYPDGHETIPYYWRHPFNSILDPSARLLDTY